MDKPVMALTYEQIDLWVASLQPELVAAGFACAVGVLRGGAPLALMVSHAAGVPVAFLRYDRATRLAQWDSSLPIPPRGSKVLICEDIAGMGHTLADCIGFLHAQGLEIRTLTAAFDDLSRIRPDYAIDARGYRVLLPWERHAHTDDFQAALRDTPAGSHRRLAEDHTFAAYALDVAVLAALDDEPGGSAATASGHSSAMTQRVFDRFGFGPERTKLLVCARPQAQRAATAAWLAARGWSGPRLLMGAGESDEADPRAWARRKAEAALGAACTHFIDADPTQAILIARCAPLVRVVWWDAQHGAAQQIAAYGWQRLPAAVAAP